MRVLHLWLRIIQSNPVLLESEKVDFIEYTDDPRQSDTYLAFNLETKTLHQIRMICANSDTLIGSETARQCILGALDYLQDHSDSLHLEQWASIQLYFKGRCLVVLQRNAHSLALCLDVQCFGESKL